MKTLKVSLVVLIFLVAAISPVQAINYAPASLNLFPGTVNNLQANPALLDFYKDEIQIQWDVASMSIWSNAWTISKTLENFNKDWDEDIKNDFLNSIPGNAFAIGAGASSNFMVGFGPRAVKTGIGGYSAAGLDKDIFEFILFGNELDEEIYVDSTFGRAQLAFDLGYSQSMDFPQFADRFGWDKVSIGGGVRYLNGIAFAELESDGSLLFSSEEDQEPVTAEGEFTALYSARGFEGGGGHGAAIDIGAWGQIDPRLGVGISLNNLGAIRWSGVRKSSFEGTVTIDPGLLIEEDEDWIKYDTEEVIDEPHDPIFRGTPFSLEGGVHYIAYPGVHLAGTVGLYQAPIFHLGISAATRFYYPEWLPITVGLDFATYKGTPSLFAGISLQAWGWEVFNLTISDIKMATGAGKEMSLKFGTAIRF